ncbi:hypothetical protein [Amycolatopsis sp. CA-230715]|uniref:hypothetical protein n=1 Tax=Amycolatopsis sp. CA-230715 TaxID=2745196 RepID=UPI001C01184B|nr:hypothetical protein [Amycolatopsis sp. CA-230715]QWF80738.1 hypothetical protein HUW46_04162 [Amycolatopsis sp. CA-230715]
MGKHTKRRMSYLPKVAAGAAPFALLLAGPATGWAATGPDLPIDHHNEHSFQHGFDKDIKPIQTPDAVGYTAFVKGFVDAMNKDTYTGDLGGAKVAAEQAQAAKGTADTADTTTAGLSGVDSTAYAKGLLAGSESQKYAVGHGPYGIAHTSDEAGRVAADGNRDLHVTPTGRVSGSEVGTTDLAGSRANTEGARFGDGAALTSNQQSAGVTDDRGEAFEFDPVAGTLDTATQEAHQVVADNSMSHAVNKGGNSVSSDNSESIGTDLDRYAGFSGSKDGHAHGVVKEGANAKAARSSTQGVTFGDLAGGTVASDQGARGSFSGVLDAERNQDGSATVVAGGNGSGELKQAHAVGGNLGPLSAAAASAQEGSVDSANHSATTVSPAGKVDSAEKSLTTGKFSDETSGSLGIDKVVSVSGSAKTTVDTAVGATQSTKDSKPGAPEVTRDASVKHDNDLQVGLLGQKPVGGGVSVDGLKVTPHVD